MSTLVGEGAASSCGLSAVCARIVLIQPVQQRWRVALPPQTYTELIGFAVCERTFRPGHRRGSRIRTSAEAAHSALFFKVDKEVKPAREHRPLLAGLGRPPALPGSSYRRVRAPSGVRARLLLALPAR